MNKSIAQLLIVVFVVTTAGFGSVVKTAKAEVTTYNAPSNKEEQLAFLYGQLLQLQIQLAILLKSQSTDRAESVPSTNRRYSNPYLMQVTTLAATSVGRNTAELQARADKGSSETSWVWFEYGVGTSLNKDSDQTKITNTRESTYKIRITDLEPDTTYSYRAVMEDEDGGLAYGQVRKITTVRPASTLSFTGKPVVESEGVTNIRSNGGEVKIFVSMNDYDNGTVFILSSSESSDLRDIEDDFENFNEIPVVRGGLSKQLVKRDVTERTTVVGRVYGATKASKVYYRACVEYERRSDLNIVCSATESFVTAN